MFSQIGGRIDLPIGSACHLGLRMAELALWIIQTAQILGATHIPDEQHTQSMSVCPEGAAYVRLAFATYTGPQNYTWCTLQLTTPPSGCHEGRKRNLMYV